MFRPLFGAIVLWGVAFQIADVLAQDTGTTSPVLPAVIVSATRLDTSIDRSPMASSVITSEQIDLFQYRFTADALRAVPGVDVVQTGTPGQVTSVFIRGARSDQTQVLLDGIPFNQGLSNAFNFADLTNDNLARIEIIRGSESALYGSQASGGVINLITVRGSAQPTGSAFFEGGSYDSFREGVSASGKIGPLDFSVGFSRYDTQNSRQNNSYYSNSLLGDTGITILPGLRLGLVYFYDYANAPSPNSTTDFRPFDRLRTERYLLAPNLEFSPFPWWHNRAYYSYDQERQVNNPNDDGFTGPTRGLFERYQLEYQTDLIPVEWLTLTLGAYYNHTYVFQDRPQIVFGATHISDLSENTAGFGQLKVTPLKNLDFYVNARYDTFLSYNSRWTYRVAVNYLFAPTGTIFRCSYATGFTPPSSQDKIFGGNPNLSPDNEKSFDIGLEQRLLDNRINLGGNFFYNTSSNVVGFNSNFVAFNLGSARIKGVEFYGTITPCTGLTLSANYTYLDAVTTSSSDISQPVGSRLPRRPRNEFNFLASYEWANHGSISFQLVSVNARQDTVFAEPNINLEDYTVLRLSGEYQIGPHILITGRIENLLDEKYSEVEGFPALGRTFYGGIKVRF